MTTPKPKIKFFIDAEFIEDGVTIDLISLGLVCENGEKFYAISNEFDPNKASDWVKENVIAKLESPMDHPELWMSRAAIRTKLLEFVREELGADGFNSENPNEPEFWGYYADYDWVVLCQLFGTMMQLPGHFPKYCRDIKQLCDFLGNPQLPEDQPEREHNALADAQWHKVAYDFLQGLMEAKQQDIDELKRKRDEAIHERDACHKCWDDFAVKVGTAIDDFAKMPLFQGADKIVEAFATLQDVGGALLTENRQLVQPLESELANLRSMHRLVLDDVLVLLAEHKYPTPETTYKEDGGWSLAYADLKKCMSNLLLIGDAQTASKAISTVTRELDALAKQGIKVIRVCEGGGPENVGASVAATIIALADEVNLTTRKEKILDAVFTPLEDRNSDIKRISDLLQLVHECCHTEAWDEIDGDDVGEVVELFERFVKAYPPNGMTDEAIKGLISHLPHIDPAFVEEIKDMCRMELQRRLLISADWHGAHNRCLNGIKEIAVIPGGGIDNCRMPNDIRKIVETLVKHCPFTWEDNCAGRLKAEQEKPYDAYWSKRALAAEKLLRRFKDHCDTPDADGVCREIALQARWHFERVDKETGLPSDVSIVENVRVIAPRVVPIRGATPVTVQLNADSPTHVGIAEDGAVIVPPAAPLEGGHPNYVAPTSEV